MKIIKRATIAAAFIMLAPSLLGAQSGKWAFVESKDKMTDKRQDFVVLDSEDTYTSATGDQEHARLIVSCVNTEQRLITATFNRTVLVGFMDMRLDDERNRSSYWALASDQTSFYFRGADKIVGQLSKHKRLLLQVNTHPNSKQVVTFDLEGMASILLEHGCPAPPMKH